jgi:hypothetical protein
MPASAKWNTVSWCNDKFIALVGDWMGGSTSGIGYLSTTSGGTSGISSNVGAYSYDGITWTAITMPSARYWSKVTYGNGVYVTVAGNTNIAAYSTNGINWTQTTLPVSTWWNRAIYGNKTFVAFAGKGSGIGASPTQATSIAAYSTDGINWTQTALPSSSMWTDIAYSTN